MYFVIQIADKCLLEQIALVMQSEHKISKRVHKKDHSVFYRLQIGSKDIIADLEQLGGIPGKTHRMKLPDIPSDFFGTFVRGYFDGDGNVWVGEIHKNRKKQLLVIQTCFTSCSQDFLLNLQRRLLLYGVYGSCYERKKQNVFRLQYSVKSSILLFQLMYKTTSNGLFLDRKKKVFKKYLLQAQLRS